MVIDNSDLVTDEVSNIFITLASVNDDDFVVFSKAVLFIMADMNIQVLNHFIQGVTLNIALINDVGCFPELPQEILQPESRSDSVMVRKVMGLDINIFFISHIIYNIFQDTHGPLLLVTVTAF